MLVSIWGEADVRFLNSCSLILRKYNLFLVAALSLLRCAMTYPGAIYRREKAQEQLESVPLSAAS